MERKSNREMILLKQINQIKGIAPVDKPTMSNLESECDGKN